MNDEKILAKLDQLEGYLEKFDSIIPVSERDYLRSFEKQLAVERLLQISIEIMIDIVMMIVKKNHLGLPADEEEAFDKLEPFIKNMHVYKEMKRFRNILVHKYGEVNDKLVFFNATNRITDFKDFINDIKNFLQESKKK